VRFEQSTNAVHGEVFCSLCEFPVKGNRSVRALVFDVRDRIVDTDLFARAAMALRSTLTATDETAAALPASTSARLARRATRTLTDTTVHTSSCKSSGAYSFYILVGHFAVTRRPLPTGTNIPKVLPELKLLYQKDALRVVSCHLAIPLPSCACAYQIRAGDAPENGSHDTACGECKKNITGIRYRCAVCDNADLCASCEAAGKHDRSHLLFKV